MSETEGYCTHIACRMTVVARALSTALTVLASLRYRQAMRWPETSRLIDRIRRERPELTVEHHSSPATSDHWFLRLYCIRKDDRRIIPESVVTIRGPEGW